MKIGTLIVDDEPLARERIKSLLSGDPEVEVVGECPDGESAIRAVSTLKPQLLFLDVQMPGMDGFAVLEEIVSADMPAIIFVTAYEKYAVKAFDVFAIDYLLKSYDRKRFEVALQRAKLAIVNKKSGQWNEQIVDLLEHHQQQKKWLSRLVIKSAGRIFFLRVDEIDWLEAADNYVKIHAGNATHLIRSTLQALESRLDPARFRRIHRSVLLNIDRIKEMQPLFHGDHTVTLIDGTQLTLSRNYRDSLIEPEE